MAATSIEDLLKAGRQEEADLLCRNTARKNPFKYHADHNNSPRVLHLISIDLATAHLNAKREKARFRVSGHWEADHFLIGKGFGTITAMIASDANPYRFVEYIHKTNREIIVNCIADPDLYSQALLAAKSIVEMAGLPIINPPSSILRHTRDAVASSLQGIPNLKVPQTARATIQPDLVVPLPFPFIARECGTQTGATMELINSAAEFDSFLERYNSREAYFTEFVDFQSPDGLYRKYRVRIVGNEIIPNHLFVNTQWNVHSQASREIMSSNPEYLAEERAFVSEPLDHLDVLREIHRRIGVDFYGIDYAVLPGGSLVLFEANASMRSERRDAYPQTWAIAEDLVDRFVTYVKFKAGTQQP